MSEKIIHLLSKYFFIIFYERETILNMEHSTISKTDQVNKN